MVWTTTRGNKIEVMGKKKKDKKAKPLPAPKKKQQITMQPEERRKHLREIKEILLNAQKEVESRILRKKLTKERSFTNEDIASFISDLKFKSEEENKKPGPLPKAVSTRKTDSKTGQSAGVSSDNITNTYYERWFRLVSRKPTVFEDFQLEEEVKVEYMTLPKSVSSTVRATYNLYKDDLTVDEIAKKRKLTVNTVYNHFCQLIEMGAVSISEILNNSKIKDIAIVIKKVGADKLSVIKSQCKPSISYNDIKLMLSHLKKKKK